MTKNVSMLTISFLFVLSMGCGGTDATVPRDNANPAVVGNGTDAGPGQPGKDGGQANDTGTSSTSAKRIFVTSNQFSGAMNGLAGADALCQEAADSMKLGGAWKALLSAHGDASYARLTEAGPWSDLRGTTIFNNKANIGTGPLALIKVDERNQEVPWYADVWTGGKSFDGTQPDCLSWTTADFSTDGTTGRAAVTDETWWSDISLSCSQQAHLYCLEQ